MKKGFLLIIAIAIVATIGVLAQDNQNVSLAEIGFSRADDLSADAQKVVDYLLADWQKQFRSTSIPLAMSNLGIKKNDDLRMEIAEHFRNNTGLARNLQWWGANNYILNHDEKLIAKYLINHFEANEAMPKRPDLLKEIGITDDGMKSRLAFIAKAGFLEQQEGSDLGYKLADGYARWGGPLRHNFHTVSIEGQQPFDVW